MTDETAREREHWPGGGPVHGQPGHPSDAAPAYWPSHAGQPVSGSPGDVPARHDEYGLPVQPHPGGFPAQPAPDRFAAQPVSGGFAEQPVSGGFAEQPVSGGFAGQPVSGGFGVQPVSGGLGAPARRIEPSPPPQRGKLLLSLLVGVLAGALLAGTGAFFLGRATAGDGDPVPVVAAPPAAVAELIAANRATFPADLAGLAEPWLADMSGCAANTDSGGPQLGPGQRSRVLCRDGGMYLHFVAYQSAEGKAADLSYRQQIALHSASILPGAEQPGRKLGGVTGAPGTYVEYATRTGRNPALCGVWWNRDNTDTAVYVDVICDSLGGKWDPLRAVWQRHS